MFRTRLLLGLGLLFAAVAPIRAADAIADGTWKLTYVSGGVTEQSPCLIKVETDNGKKTAAVAALSPRIRDVSLTNVKIDGNTIRFELKGFGDGVAFEGKVSSSDAKTVLGTMGDDQRLFPARLTVTDLKELKQEDAFGRIDIEPMQKALTTASKAALAKSKAANSKDDDEKANLLKEAADAEAELPKLYQEVVDKHSDTPAATEAAVTLLRGATKNKATAEQVRALAAAALKPADPFGPRWKREVRMRTVEALAPQKAQAAVAVELARQAEKELPKDAAPAQQARALKALILSLKNAGKADETKDLAVSLERVENILDKEYTAKVPPFKPTKFDGRRGKSDRVVVMELFTGAQCPPCVAADVGFDVLLKTYKPSEVIFLQYHMHIPGPDPLTNADTEARWKQYTDFGTVLRGTPSTLFNGKSEAGGGGGMANAEKKYSQYREIIDPLLENAPGAKIEASAVRRGDKIEISANVSGLEKPGEKKRLRLVLVEETVRYTGGNGLRLHHNVVRDFPGGVDGFALKEKEFKQKATVDLAELRTKLGKYLDDYAETKRPFANPDRPMEFKKLAVVALVQDDESGEILQAAQVEVQDRSPEAP